MVLARTSRHRGLGAGWAVSHPPARHAALGRLTEKPPPKRRADERDLDLEPRGNLFPENALFLKSRTALILPNNIRSQLFHSTVQFIY